MNSGVLCLFLAAIVASVAAEPGFIQVYNTGGYVAYISLEYKEGGQVKTVESDNIPVGATKTLKIPEGATNVSYTVKLYVFFGITSDIFSDSASGPVKRCYKTWGTTLSSNYAKSDC